MGESEPQIAAGRPPDSSALSFECLTDVDEIEAIAPQWSICNRAFSAPAWFMAAYQSQPEATLQTIVARRKGTLAGILPVVVNKRTRLAEFATAWNDYHDMITAAGDLEAMRGLLHYLCTQGGGYDTIALQRLRYDSNCFQALRSLFPEPQWKKYFVEEPVKYTYVPLPSGYEKYLAGLPGKFRKNLQYLKRKAQASISIRELRPSFFDPAQLPEIFLSLHLARFGARTSFAEAGEQAFVRYLFPRLFAQGSLRAWAIFQEERVIAMAMNMVGPQSLCLWNGGFVSEAERWSPGTLLTDAALHWACDAGLAEYDFLRGTEDYKKNWSCDFRAAGSIELPARVGFLRGAAL
jgi:CelD/BcsL family acetyltransferase involved in cellulose biosynthesis